jgi:hypothetical protein
MQEGDAVTLEIIQVQKPEAEGWVEWAWNRAKERPYFAALAAPAAVVASPFIATTAASVSVAAAGGVLIAGASEMIWGPGSPPPVTLYSADEAGGIVDAHGEPLAPGLTYLRHPKSSESSVLIRSTDFHDFIMKEKVAEIVHYMRSETRLKSLSILVRSSDSKHVVVGGKLKAVPGTVKADLKNEHERRMSVTYEGRSRPPRQRYIWIDEFPEVIAATRNARKGTMSFSQSTDMSFGLSGDAAKFMKLQAGWLTTFLVEVDAAFA